MRRATSGGPVDTAQKLGNCGTQVITGRQACGRNAYCEWGRLKNRYWATQRVLVVAAHRTHRGQAIRSPLTACTNTMSHHGQTIRTSYHIVDRLCEHHVISWTDYMIMSHLGQITRKPYEHHATPWTGYTNIMSLRGKAVRTPCLTMDRLYEHHVTP